MMQIQQSSIVKPIDYSLQANNSTTVLKQQYKINLPKKNKQKIVNIYPIIKSSYLVHSQVSNKRKYQSIKHISQKGIVHNELKIESVLVDNITIIKQQFIYIQLKSSANYQNNSQNKFLQWNLLNNEKNIHKYTDIPIQCQRYKTFIFHEGYLGIMCYNQQNAYSYYYYYKLPMLGFNKPLILLKLNIKPQFIMKANQISKLALADYYNVSFCNKSLETVQFKILNFQTYLFNEKKPSVKLQDGQQYIKTYKFAHCMQQVQKYDLFAVILKVKQIRPQVYYVKYESQLKFGFRDFCCQPPNINYTKYQCFSSVVDTLTDKISFIHLSFSQHYHDIQFINNFCQTIQKQCKPRLDRLNYQWNLTQTVPSPNNFCYFPTIFVDPVDYKPLNLSKIQIYEIQNMKQYQIQCFPKYYGHKQIMKSRVINNRRNNKDFHILIQQYQIPQYVYGVKLTTAFLLQLSNHWSVSQWDQDLVYYTTSLIEQGEL